MAGPCMPEDMGVDGRPAAGPQPPKDSFQISQTEWEDAFIGRKARQQGTQGLVEPRALEEAHDGPVVVLA
eukprot:3167475-Lingulodinium_polyedra.AAC.1